jgi:RNA polymerase sigma-70 factor, ECF subfamily
VHRDTPSWCPRAVTGLKRRADTAAAVAGGIQRLDNRVGLIGPPRRLQFPRPGGVSAIAETMMDAAVLDDLIGRARRREPAAFDALVEAYSPRLYGYFYRLTGLREDAEDLLQEVFVRLVRMIDRYEHDGRFDAWLFRIATNLVRDRVRRQKRASGAPFAGLIDPDQPGSIEELPDRSSVRPQDALDHAEDVDRLQRALSRLPEGEREVILLRHFSQMSFKEVAETMGTPLGTALARAHRGLARLRELMERDASRER